MLWKLMTFSILCICILSNHSFCKGNTTVIEQTGCVPILLAPQKINYLVAGRAHRSASIGEFPPQSVYHSKRFWLTGWTSPVEFIEWKVEAPTAGQYCITVLAEAGEGTEIQVQNRLGNLTFRFANSGWQREAMGILPFAAGSSTLRLELVNQANVAIKALELLHIEEQTAHQRRITEFRADTTWLAESGYGIMFQTGEWSYPPQGEKKTWPGFAQDFQLESFVDMVEKTGAGFVVWSATWRTYYFPAPIKAIDEILLGRTSKRDLVMEIANELTKRGIKLILYYHVGHGDQPNTNWWNRNWNPNWLEENYDKSLFFKNWQNIITEVGERYGKKLAGWLFDDDCVIYPADYETLGRAAKAGNPDRLVAYNSWIGSRFTEFQDYSFGEGFLGADKETVTNGKFVTGPFKGLQAFGCVMLDGPDWGVYQPNFKILPPFYSEEKAAAIARHAAQTKAPIAFNLLMYEDGTVSPASLKTMERIRQVVRIGAKLETVYPEPAMIEMSVAEKEDIRRMVRAVGKQPKANQGTMLETEGTIAADKGSKAIEQWISRYRTTIDGTQIGPFLPTDSYVTTQRDDIIYVHILDWQGKNNVSLPTIDRVLKRAYPLSDPRDNVNYVSLGWVREEHWGLLLVVPEEFRGDPYTIFVLEME